MSSSSYSSAFDSGVTEKPSSPSGLEEKEGSSKPCCCSRKRPRDEHVSSKPSSPSKKLMKNVSPPVDLYLVSENMIKEALEMFNAEAMKTFDSIMNDVLALIENIVNAAKKAISDIPDGAKPERALGLIMCYARKLSSLSKEDAETLDHKWKAQLFMEMEIAENRAKLMLEEYRLRSPLFSQK